MDEVARYNASDRSDLFRVAAEKRSLPEEIIEKDFWVCWTLKQLFALRDPDYKMLFKGGTSLSKAYGAIARFSEDVDLSLDRASLGFTDDRDPAKIQGSKRRERVLQELAEKRITIVTGPILDQLRKSFEASLRSAAGWQLDVAEDEGSELALLFKYPRAKRDGLHDESSYLKPIIRLEFGARSDHWPVEERTIKPYAAEALPSNFRESDCNVSVLDAKRTFWEKATILHQWHHIRDNKHLPPRQSRHYYDLAMLATHEIGRGALADVDLLSKVAAHKQIFFRAAWAQYETAKPGTLKLVPKDSRIEELRRDYEAMREMIFTDPPSFAELLDTLRRTEEQINGVSG